MSFNNLSAGAQEWTPSFGGGDGSAAASNGTSVVNATDASQMSFEQLQAMLQQLAAGKPPPEFAAAAAEAENDEANLAEIEVALAQEEITTFLDEQGA